MRPLISVITINLNNSDGLSRTFDSVRERKNDDFEYIVIDGGSTDGSLEVIEKHSGIIDKLVVEADNGVFDAFNKGLRHCCGEWICMLNSGDQLLSAEGLEKELREVDGTVHVVAGCWIHNGEVRRPGRFSDLRLGRFPFCHQAMFIRRGHFYNSNFRIFGDLELLARYYRSSPEAFASSELVMAQYEGGGISAERSFRKRAERLKVVFFYFGIDALFTVIKGFIHERFS